MKQAFVHEQYLRIKRRIEEAAVQSGREASSVRLIAVSKSRPFEDILSAYDAGCRDFGENRIPEAMEKISRSPEGIEWHFLGKLQRKKVNKALGFFHLIHSVDSPELAREIAKKSVERGIVTNILLQVNTSGEESKQGLEQEECKALFPSLFDLQGLRIKGLMTMAPLTEDEKAIRGTFSRLRLLKEELNASLNEEWALKELSMGMSHDYAIAVEEGATIVRVGTAIFSGV